jgi:ferric-dicitrate binding protein FerR (iron transport regulator)
MASDKSIRLIEKIISNSASKEEITQFNSWLEKSDDNRRFYLQVKAIWDSIGRSNNRLTFNEAAAKNNLILKVQQNRTKTRVQKARFWISAAASLLILIGLGYLVYNLQTLRNGSIHYSTLNDEIREVILPDDSHVWLNENSYLELTKSFNKRRRKVFLQGEAYFEVTRNEEKPFKVIVHKTITKVLGTSFNLKSDEDGNVVLIVNSGKVAFYKKYSLEERRIYTRGDKGEFSINGNRITQYQNDNKNYLSWKTDILTFSNTPLTEVCKVLTNHFGVRVISTVNDSDLSLTGTFRDEELEAILSTIAITLEIEVFRSDHGVVLNKIQN